MGGLSIFDPSRREPQAQGYCRSTMYREARIWNVPFLKVGKGQFSGEKNNGSGRNKGPRGRTEESKGCRARIPSSLYQMGAPQKEADMG